MLKFKLFTIYVFFRSFLLPCQDERPGADACEDCGSYTASIKRTGRLDPKVNESSGLEVKQGAPLRLWTINDSGSDAMLYEVDSLGALHGKVLLKEASNHDWEDLAKDDKGNLFIGDFGNNQNKRKDLRIYKLAPSGALETIHFSFEDQAAFPPPRAEMNFDCEAFFWYQGKLYLFSKNRGDQVVKMYELPDDAGVHKARLVDRMRIPGMVTAADIDPTNSLFALLVYGKVYFFHVGGEGNITFDHPAFCKRFSRAGQSEGLVFISEHELMISNENRKLWLMKLKERKRK